MTAMCSSHSACIVHLPARCVSKSHSCCLRSLISAAASGSPYTPASYLAQRASASCLPEVASATWLFSCLHCQELTNIVSADVDFPACISHLTIQVPACIARVSTSVPWLALMHLPDGYNYLTGSATLVSGAAIWL